MRHCGVRVMLTLLFATLIGVGHSQQIQSTYADLTMPGSWQAANQHAAAQSGSDVFYDQAQVHC